MDFKEYCLSTLIVTHFHAFVCNWWNWLVFEELGYFLGSLLFYNAIVFLQVMTRQLRNMNRALPREHLSVKMRRSEKQNRNTEASRPCPRVATAFFFNEWGQCRRNLWPGDYQVTCGPWPCERMKSTPYHRAAFWGSWATPSTEFCVFTLSVAVFRRFLLPRFARAICWNVPRYEGKEPSKRCVSGASRGLGNCLKLTKSTWILRKPLKILENPTESQKIHGNDEENP